MPSFTLKRVEGPVPSTSFGNTAFSALVEDVVSHEQEWVHVEVDTDDLAVPTALIDVLCTTHPIEGYDCP